MPLKKEDGLTFVVTTNPYDESNAANKKRVRSIAASKSWPERRKRTFEQYEKSGENPGAFLLKGSMLTQAQATAQAKSAVKQKLQRSQPRRTGLSTPLDEPDCGSSNLEITPEALQSCMREKTPELPCQCQKCWPEQQVTRRPLAVAYTRRRLNDGSAQWTRDLAMLTPPCSPKPSSPVTNMADPFNCYPVPYRPWFDGILHHMLTVFAPRGWPALKITRDQGLKWEWWMTQHALSEPALFYVRLLFATGDLIELGVMKREVSYYLQDEAIKSINEALEDPKRATSDPLILAVGRIALHESLYGDKHAAIAIHRPAQRRMIQMRGGMKALDFPELVKRLMRWSDIVMAKRSGTERFLEDEEDEPNFTMKESVRVLEKWVPSEGEALRSKIKISDLVNDDKGS